ncbi:MAG: glycosyl transferase family 8 [Bryobacterales bacterium]|nr:glycosyl transferase family 8 [Bryobacterales bacterium]
MTLPIACAINNDYALPLLVMLTSLKEHLRPSYQLVLYLVHQGVSEELLASISRLVETHSIVPSPESLAAIPRHPHFPREAAYSLLLPELLPGTLDRILFLDADLLVLDDLAQLWEISMGDRALAAAPDAAIPLCCSPRGVKKRDEWGISEDAVYFNCGVMLVRLSGWRERDVTRRACGYLQKVGRQVDFLHQEALNAILWDDWLPLESRWNLLGSMAGRPYEQSGSGAWRQPGIVHFAGRFKPWRARIGGPFDQHYRAFLSRATQWVPAVKPTLRDKLLSLYDRHLRNSLYGCERALWNRRLL